MSYSLFLVRLVVWTAPSLKDHCLWNMEMLWIIGPVRRPDLSKWSAKLAYCQGACVCRAHLHGRKRLHGLTIQLLVAILGGCNDMHPSITGQLGRYPRSAADDLHVVSWKAVPMVHAARLHACTPLLCSIVLLCRSLTLRSCWFAWTHHTLPTAGIYLLALARVLHCCCTAASWYMPVPCQVQSACGEAEWQVANRRMANREQPMLG
ncbi:hypothetical protein F4824DRAFT_62728 [Ustulina deusta]|nr:hypothetical protein F4823DRAFT_349772 [Ustulina deusta]KAI3338860.1 hypothetical protein F4824DRAFT_62728 [Ustulina deusta]